MKNKQKTFSELNALKGKIREEKTNYRKVAEEMVITPATLCLKLNGKSPIKGDEVELLCKILNIQPCEINKYFFPNVLQNATK